jgi:hypothetical protein
MLLSILVDGPGIVAVRAPRRIDLLLQCDRFGEIFLPDPFHAFGQRRRVAENVDGMLDMLPIEIDARIVACEHGDELRREGLARNDRRIEQRALAPDPVAHLDRNAANRRDVCHDKIGLAQCALQHVDAALELVQRLEHARHEAGNERLVALGPRPRQRLARPGAQRMKLVAEGVKHGADLRLLAQFRQSKRPQRLVERAIDVLLLQPQCVLLLRR